MDSEKKAGSVDQKMKNLDEQRREFLRKSLYAAYATPVIMSMLVENASAVKSQGLDKACRQRDACIHNPECWEAFPDRCPP